MIEGKDYFIAKTCSAMHIITFSLCIIKSKLHFAAKALVYFQCRTLLFQFKIFCLIESE